MSLAQTGQNVALYDCLDRESRLMGVLGESAVVLIPAVDQPFEAVSIALFLRACLP
ncbi:MAG: hypothetical protein AAFU53_14200 [Cyanobacteria bacterium J06632_3]